MLAAETEEGAREETAEKHKHQLGQAERPGHETASPEIGWRGIESFGDDVERTNQKSERGGKKHLRSCGKDKPEPVDGYTQQGDQVLPNEDQPGYESHRNCLRTRGKDEKNIGEKNIRKEYKKEKKRWEHDWWLNFVEEVKEAEQRGDARKMYKTLK